MNDPQKLIPVYALLSRIRLSSSQGVLESAEKVIKLKVPATQPDSRADPVSRRPGRESTPRVRRRVPDRAGLDAKTIVTACRGIQDNCAVHALDLFLKIEV